MVIGMLALFAILIPSPTYGEQVVPGHAVLAKPTGDALVIWDASSVVASIVKGKIKDAAANERLERDAVYVLSTVARGLDKSAKMVTVRIIYSKSGAVSPVYGTPTFKGVERYATLAASAGNLRLGRNHWEKLDPKMTIPRWFVYHVTGLLPPR